MKNKIINILLEHSFQIPNNDAENTYDMVISMFDFGSIADQIIKLFDAKNNSKDNGKITGLDTCDKCGEFFMSRLIKPLTICDSCHDELEKELTVIL